VLKETTRTDLVQIPKSSAEKSWEGSRSDAATSSGRKEVLLVVAAILLVLQTVTSTCLLLFL
jgi:hypothetical protein